MTNSNLPRVTQKIFGENAGQNIGQFGSAITGTPNPTGDISEIQALGSWGEGWAGAVLPTRDFPALEEMTGIQKVITQQLAYFFQKGFPEWDENTTYFATTSLAQVNGVVYQSLTNNNKGNNPTTSSANWKIWDPNSFVGANVDLSNLSGTGENHFANPNLSNITDTAEQQIDTVAARPLSDNACTQENFPDEFDYWQAQAHSTFDLSKFEVVGSPTITDDGIASGFNTSSIIKSKELTFKPQKSLKFKCAFTTGDDVNTSQYALRFYNNLTGYFITNAIYIENGYINVKATDYTNASVLKVEPNSTYYAELIWTKDLGYYVGRCSTNNIDFTEAPITSAKTPMQGNNSVIWIGNVQDINLIKPFLGSIDLKSVAVWVDDKPVFSGNKTAIDTINDTLEIPYTESTDGTKIVDAAYFDRVQSCYEQTGEALYLTLDEQNQAYYLPQGTVSGMISRNKEGLEEIEARIEQIKAQIGFTLFDTKITDHVLSGNDAVGWALQGSLVTNIYTDAVSNIASAYASGTATTYREIPCKRATDGRYIADISQKTAIDELFEETGVADFYIYDSANSQFYLPKNKWFMQLTADSTALNQYNESALPNITATGTGSAVGGQSQIGGAAFSSGINFERWQGGNQDSKRIDFSASRSSSVYKSGQKYVQPPSSNKLLYYKVGDTLTNNTAIDIGNMSNIISDLSSKTQIDDVLINGSSGYILLSNNTLIQWGNSGTSGSTNLLKSYANTNYIILTGHYNGPEKGLYASRFCTHSKTTTSFSWTIETMGNYWLTIGQGATS